MPNEEIFREAIYFEEGLYIRGGGVYTFLQQVNLNPRGSHRFKPV